MKTLYLDLGMGAAGDMLTAALLELLPDPEEMMRKLNALEIPGVEFKNETTSKCGINGTHMSVTVHGEEEESHDVHDHESHDHEDHEHDHEHSHEGHEHDHEHSHEDHDHEHSHEDHEHDHGHSHEDHDHEHSHEDHVHDYEHHHDHEHSHDHHHHHHSSMHDIEHLVNDHLAVSDRVKKDVLAVYSLIAEAESHVHGVPVSEIHFHEVGTMDAVADITAVCMLMEAVAPDEVVASPVHVGSGHVRCAHGILPVPAPATAYILRDVPMYGGRIRGELCTPTGAALLKRFVTRFGDMPVMKAKAVGYGMGKKDFEMANCVRAILGETQDQGDVVYELSCNIDDMTGEKIGFAMEQLFELGALDVYTTPIGMKKSRPGILFRVLCREQDRNTMAQAMFKYTTTIGIREQKMNRYVLQRSFDEVETRYGVIRRKNVSGYGVVRSKPEYEDLAKAAAAYGVSIAEVEREAENSR